MSDKMIVRKHQDFVLAKNIWSGFEGKLIAILIKELELNKDDVDQFFKTQSISLKEIEKILCIKTMSTTEIKQVINKLVSKAIYINEVDKKTKKRQYVAMPFFSELKYIHGESEILFEFNYRMRPYLLNFQQNFVKYHIKNIIKFKSKYAIGIYELCRNDLNFKKEKYPIVEMDLESLREWLQTPKSYDGYDRFREKVLVPVCSDITKYSDVAINYKEVKRGRKVVAIKFVFSENLREGFRLRYWELLIITHSTFYKKDKKLKIEIKEAIQTLREQSRKKI
jgi:plasmid replication initiation protein